MWDFGRTQEKMHYVQPLNKLRENVHFKCVASHRASHIDLEVKLKEFVGSKNKGVLHNMQKAVLSGTLNISWTFKVAT